MSEAASKPDYAAKSAATFSAERKEDLFVLAVAAITVALVLSGAISPSFYKSLFF
jgi:hypothetical protein